jgi:hypothetical protein
MNRTNLMNLRTASLLSVAWGKSESRQLWATVAFIKRAKRTRARIRLSSMNVNV